MEGRSVWNFTFWFTEVCLTNCFMLTSDHENKIPAYKWEERLFCTNVTQSLTSWYCSSGRVSNTLHFYWITTGSLDDFKQIFPYIQPILEGMHFYSFWKTSTKCVRMLKQHLGCSHPPLLFKREYAFHWWGKQSPCESLLILPRESGVWHWHMSLAVQGYPGRGGWGASMCWWHITVPFKSSSWQPSD